MDTLLPQEEATTIKSYIFDMYEKGLEKGHKKGVKEGMEKLIAAFIRNNPSASDSDIAQSHDIPVALVKKIRQQVKDGDKS